MFRKLYIGSVQACSKVIECPDLTWKVEHVFVTLATNLLALRVDPKQAHKVQLQGNRLMRLVFSLDSCSFCLLRHPVYVLDCAHRLCSSCLGAHSNPSDIPPQIPSCPVCQHHNKKPVIHRPPTAGSRNLYLSGNDAEEMLYFLTELQRCCSLNSMPLRDHFDNISGSGIGMYLVK